METWERNIHTLKHGSYSLEGVLCEKDRYMYAHIFIFYIHIRFAPHKIKRDFLLITVIFKDITWVIKRDGDGWWVGGWLFPTKTDHS